MIHIWHLAYIVYGGRDSSGEYWFKSKGLLGEKMVSKFAFITMVGFSGISISRLLPSEDPQIAYPGYCVGFCWYCHPR